MTTTSENSTTEKLKPVQQLLSAGNAQRAFLKLIELSKTESENTDFLKLLVVTLRAKNDHKGMLKAARAIFQRAQDFGTRYIYFEVCLELAEFKELSAAVDSIDPSQLNADSLMKYLDISMELAIHHGDIEKIFSHQRMYESKGLVSPRYFYSMALVDMKSAKESEAIGHLRQALNIDAKMDIAWTALALLHHKRGDYELAIGNLQSALDSNPFNQTALKLFSAWSSDQATINKAEKYLNFYLDRFTFDESMTMNKISLFERAGRFDWAHCEYSKLKYYFS